MINKLRPVLDRANPLLKYMSVRASNLIAAFPMNESSGTVMRNHRGAAGNGSWSGVALGGANFRGIPVPTFDNVNDFGNFYSAALNAAFTPALFSLSLRYKITPALLTDAAIDTLVRIRTDANNQITLQQSATDNVFDFNYVAGGTTDTVAATISSTGWNHLGLVVDVAGNAMKAFVNGVQSGTTQTGLGTWVGALASTHCCVGVQNTGGTLPYGGNLFMLKIWNIALSDAEMVRDAA